MTAMLLSCFNCWLSQQHLSPIDRVQAVQVHAGRTAEGQREVAQNGQLCLARILQAAAMRWSDVQADFRPIVLQGVSILASRLPRFLLKYAFSA